MSYIYENEIQRDPEKNSRPWTLEKSRFIWSSRLPSGIFDFFRQICNDNVNSAFYSRWASPSHRTRKVVLVYLRRSSSWFELLNMHDVARPTSLSVNSRVSPPNIGFFICLVGYGTCFKPGETLPFVLLHISRPEGMAIVYHYQPSQGRWANKKRKERS